MPDENAPGLVDVTISTFDGELTRLRVRPSETMGHVRRRLQTPGGPRLNLCCEGAVLADEAVVASLPSHRQLSGWHPRHTRHRSEQQQHSHRAARAVGAALDRRAVLAAARRWALRGGAAARLAAAAAHSLGLAAWLRLGLWLALFWASGRVELGGPFLIASAAVLVWHIGFSERGAEAESAYTVFNRGFRALPGQLHAEDVQRQVAGGGF